MPTAQRTAPVNAATGGGSVKMTSRLTAMPTEKWVAIITLGALLLLILIRQGFRGVNVLGVSAGVS